MDKQKTNTIQCVSCSREAKHVVTFREGDGGVNLPICSVDCRYDIFYEINNPCLKFFAVMRDLWRKHVDYTRQVILIREGQSRNKDDPTSLEKLKSHGERLTRNQTNIADVVSPYIGKNGSNALEKLLNEHIGIAISIVNAAILKDSDLVERQRRRWSQNAVDIASLIGSVRSTLMFGGRIWSANNIKKALDKHLDLTFKEAVAILRGEWLISQDLYDKAQDQITGIADVLSIGIVKNWPNTVRTEMRKKTRREQRSSDESNHHTLGRDGKKRGKGRRKY